MWEHFAHQADIGIKATAESLSEAFQDAAVGLTAIIAEPKKIECADEVEINLVSDNTEMLFYDWLNAVIYEIATRHMLFGRFEVEIDDLKLSAKMWGEKIDFQKHS